jgi:hypothetical protein
MSDQALEDDLDKLVDKVAQIDSTINDLRGNGAALTGTAAPISPRFHPLLVVAEAPGQPDLTHRSSRARQAAITPGGS